MTSGLVYPDDCTEPGKAVDKVFAEACDRLDTERPMTTRELADRLARCPLAFEPGTRMEIWNLRRCSGGCDRSDLREKTVGIYAG